MNQPRILGTLHTANGAGCVRIEDRFETNRDDLWSALVDPERLSRWLGEFVGELRLGGEFRATFFASGWTGRGRVERCNAPEHVLISTESADDGQHTIEAWLRAEGENTVLIIEERGMPRDQLAAYGAGLQVHVEDLGSYLAGLARADAAARWQQLIPSYRDLPVGSD